MGSLGWLLFDGLEHRWVSKGGQWANEDVRTSLAAVNVVSTAAGERPNILVMNFLDGEDETGTNVAYGWAKTYTNIYRTGLPGTSARFSATYLGTVENFLQDQPTLSTRAAQNYDLWSRRYLEDIDAKRAAYPAPHRWRSSSGSSTGRRGRVRRSRPTAWQVGPDVWVLKGPNLWVPPPDVVAQAQAAAKAQQAAFADHPGAVGRPAAHAARAAGHPAAGRAARAGSPRPSSNWRTRPAASP